MANTSRATRRNEPDPYLICSQPRCGSTLLRRVLHNLPGQSVCFEPFADADIRSRRSLRRALKRVVADNTGLKHVYDPYGWPFGSNVDLNAELVRRVPVVVLMQRRNRLRQFVSNEMAIQTDHYHSPDVVAGAAPGPPPDFRYLPNEVSYAGRWFGAQDKAVAAIERSLEASGTRFTRIDFEEFARADVDLDSRIAAVLRLIEFLGVEVDPVDARTVCRAALDVSRRVTKSEGDYRMIPNIDELEEAFAGDTYGSLFS